MSTSVLDQARLSQHLRKALGSVLILTMIVEDQYSVDHVADLPKVNGQTMIGCLVDVDGSLLCLRCTWNVIIALLTAGRLCKVGIAICMEDSSSGDTGLACTVPVHGSPKYIRSQNPFIPSQNLVPFMQHTPTLCHAMPMK